MPRITYSKILNPFHIRKKHNSYHLKKPKNQINALNKMGIPTLSNYLSKNSLKGKTIGMRLELNVVWGAKDGKLIIKNPSRIEKAWPDLKTAIKAGANIAIMYHVEDKNANKNPVDKNPFKDNQLIFEYLQNKIKQELGSSIKIDRVTEKQFLGAEAKAKLQDLKSGKTNILLMQNVRLNPMDRKQEKENSPALIKDLIPILDAYIDCGTGLMHRNASTNNAIKSLMKQEKKPVIAGDIFISETKILNQLLEGFKTEPDNSIAIFGGSKIANTYDEKGKLKEEGKIKILNTFMDLGIKNIAIGGKMVSAFLSASGKKYGDTIIKPEELKLAKEILAKAKAKNINLILPTDFITVKSSDLHKVLNGNQQVQTYIEREISDDKIQVDIGPVSAKILSNYIKNRSYRMWNGPVGIFENPKYAQGTNTLAFAFANAKTGLGVLGGGDTNDAVKSIISKDTIYTKILAGGGAPMSYLSANGNLPTISLMKNN